MTIRKLVVCSVFILSIVFFASLAIADTTREVFIQEDFTTPTFPPTGWTISSNAVNWSRFNGNNAGGTTPELRFNWSPQFNASSYFISPSLDLTGNSTVILDFKHFVDYYAQPFSIGVATRSNNGTWNTVWSASPTANVGPETRSVTISNADVGSSTFQFAFYFSGNSYNIDYWYIDDIKLYTPFPYDLAVTDASGPSHIIAGNTFTPICTIKNVGLNSLTAVVSCDIYEWDQLMQSYPAYYQASINSGQQQQVTFPSYLLVTPDEMYKFVFTITSLEDVIDEDMANNVLNKWVDTYTMHKQCILLEIGTGTWCQYCPGAAMAADDFIAGGYNIAVIENHNGDPYANTYSNARNNYYGITGYPTAVFDGLLKYVGGSNTTSVFPGYLPLFQQRVNIMTPFGLSIYGEDVGQGNFNISVYLDQYANMIYQNLVLHFVLTESEIMVNWQGQNHLNFVTRLMAPDENGTPLNLNGRTEHIIPLNFNLNTSWNGAHCELVAFIQDLDTKEVIQANKVMLVDLEPPPVSNNDNTLATPVNILKVNYPNPFSGITNIEYSIKNDSPVIVEVYNVKGQVIKTLINKSQKAGSHTVIWDGTNDYGDKVSAGVYFYKINAGKYTSSRKMIMMK